MAPAEGVGMPETGPCAACARSPLVGESVTIVAFDGPEAVVCDLCAEKPRALRLGTAVRRERVRSAAGALTVKRTIAVPERPGIPISLARAA